MIRTKLKQFYRNNHLRTKKSIRMASNNSNVIGYAEDDVLFSNKNLARVITLNRPKKLNSLNTSMVTKITPRLLEYAKSSVNNVIILTSNSPKGLCAGGDVAECAKQIKEGNPGYASNFFQNEYNMNYLISTYSKPYISIMDGITMGGGVGLSVHAPFRIATERTKLAMPEMDIGFFPDVGTTFFLPRLDDKLGYYYALTGEVLSGLDAYMAGFATHYVPSERIPQLVNRLSNLQPPVVNDKPNDASILKNSKDYFAQINQAIEEFTETKLPDGYTYPLTKEQITLINNAFSQSSFEKVIDVFDKDGSEFGQSVVKKLSTKPLSSLKVGFELLNHGSKNTIKKQLELELIAATNIMNIKPEMNDFVKGVSHKLIDKIKSPPQPKWNTGDLVSDASIKKILEPSLYTAKLDQPFIQKFFGIDYKSYPFNMGLPSNKDVENYITGNDGSGRSYLPTPSEVVKYFKSNTNNKLGLEMKLEKILSIHGEASKYDDKYVSWKN
ncbi:uncharacterized protein PRCAT00000631001 [Priceomyces carsonii]|uniref:uncharacterized protein n=1 Tax=Priceomyces carsonii TaxID=28549 RepID=UPI002EDAEA14|nr:unnamed protein product [Priceomyces carsonii]